MDGTAAGATTGALIGAGAGATTGAATGEATGAATGGVTGGDNGAAIGEAAGAATGGVTGATTGAATGEATGAATGGLTGGDTGAATGGLTGGDTGAATGAATGEATGAATGATTGALTGAATGAVAGALIGGGAAGAITGALIGAGAGAFTGALIGATTGAFTGAGAGTFFLSASTTGASVGGAAVVQTKLSTSPVHFSKSAAQLRNAGKRKSRMSRRIASRISNKPVVAGTAAVSGWQLFFVCCSTVSHSFSWLEQLLPSCKPLFLVVDSTTTRPSLTFVVGGALTPLRLGNLLVDLPPATSSFGFADTTAATAQSQVTSILVFTTIIPTAVRKTKACKKTATV